MSVSDKFRDGNPKNWDTGQPQETFLELSREHIPNPGVQHRAIIQALTILNTQNRGHIEEIKKRSRVLTRVILGLTAVIIILSGLELHKILWN